MTRGGIRKGTATRIRSARVALRVCPGALALKHAEKRLHLRRNSLRRRGDFCSPLSGALTLGASCSRLQDFWGPCFLRRRWFSSGAGTEADFRRAPQGLTGQDLDSGTRRGRLKQAGLAPPGHPGTPSVETLSGVTANSVFHCLTPPPPPRAGFRVPLCTCSLLQLRLSWGTARLKSQRL